METLIIVLLCVCTIIYVTSLVADIILKIKNSKRHPEGVNIEVLKLLLSENSAEKIDTALDQFINAAGDNYTLFKLTQNTTHYITEEIQKEMILYIKASVMKNMTKEMRTLIGLTHVINSEEDLEDLITVRTKLYVLNYMVNYNRPLNSNEDVLI